jgi:hypothetical protein
MNKHIVVVGAGAAGYFTAAAIKRNLPEINVTVVYDPNTPTINVGEALNWSATHFMKDILGLVDAQWVSQSRSAFKLGTHHHEWDGTEIPFFASNTWNVAPGILKYYRPGNIELLVEKSARLPMTKQDYTMLDVYRHLHTKGLLDQPYAAYSSKSYWFAKTKQMPIDNNGDWLIDDTSYSYHINAALVGPIVHNLVGKPNGVKEIAVKIQQVVLNEQGNIDHLILNNDQKVYADLFIDCSGFARVLAKQLPFKFEHLDEYSNNSGIVGPHKYKDYSEHKNHAYLRAMDQGWHFSVSMDHRSGEGYIYNSRITQNIDQLIDEYYTKTGKRDVNFRSIKWEPGYQKDAFVKNCITIGLSHGLSDAYDANAFSATMLHIEKVVNALKQDIDFTFNWRDGYNHSVSVRNNDIILRIQIAFYLAKRNDTDYWKEMTIAAKKNRTYERLLNEINNQNRNIKTKNPDFAYTQGVYQWVCYYYQMPFNKLIDIDTETEKKALLYFNELKKYHQDLAKMGTPVAEVYKSMYPGL